MTAAWLQVPFTDALADVSKAAPIRLTSNEYLKSGPIPIIDQGARPVAGYWKRSEDAVRVTTPLIVFGDHTKALKLVDHDFCVGAEGVKIFEPRSDFDANFLFQFLRTISLPEVGYSRHFKFLQRVIVPKPPLDEQRRIAAILDQADDLRRKRRLVLEKLDTLPQAIFQEMFGGAVADPKEWPMQRLGDIAERVTVGHVGPTSEFFCNDGIPFLRTGNVGEREIDLSDLKYITEAFHVTLAKSTVKSGDVLVSRVISDHVRCAIVPRELDGANCANVIIIRPGKNISSDYIAELIRQKKSQDSFLGRQVGSAQTVINTGVFKQWTIPVPARGDQKRYSEKIAEVAVLLLSQRASLTKLDQLFASLQHRAFSGQLRASLSARALAV